MVDELVVKVVTCNVSKTRANAKLEWQDAMGVNIAALIRDETWEMVLCPDSVKIAGCMWVDNRESWSGGIVYPYTTCLEAKGFNQ